MTWLQTWIINQDPVARLAVAEKGGPGSGNWGHAGVKGQRGGSAPKRGMGAAMSLASGPTADLRQFQAKEDSVLDQMSDDAVANYQMAVKRHNMNRETRWNVLQAWKGAKEAHKYDGSTPLTDTDAMSDAIYYAGRHGSLDNARYHYEAEWSKADRAGDRHKAGTALGHIDRIEAMQGKKPKIYDDPKGKKGITIHHAGKLKKPATEAKNAMAAKKVSDDFYIARVEGFVKGGKVQAIEWQKVKGRSVKVPGFEDQDLFIHRPAGSKTGWQLSEGRTGSALGYSGRTQKEVIQNFQLRLQNTNSAGFTENVRRVIEGQVERNGYVPISPRYEGGVEGIITS